MSAKMKEIIPANDAVPLAPSQGDTLVLMIERIACNPDIPIERLEKVLDLQERYMRQRNQEAFDAAFAQMQPELPVVERKGKISGESKRTGEILSQKYGRWEDISPAIMPVLAKHGFGIRFKQEPVTDITGAAKTRITCILSHARGHREEAFFDLPLDTTGSKNNVQAYGSTASYGRRYSAMLALNIVTKGEDDDGNTAGNGGPINDTQCASLIKLMDEVGVDKAKFCNFFHIDGVAMLPAAKFQQALSMCNAKKARR